LPRKHQEKCGIQVSGTSTRPGQEPTADPAPPTLNGNNKDKYKCNACPLKFEHLFALVKHVQACPNRSACPDGPAAGTPLQSSATDRRITVKISKKFDRRICDRKSSAFHAVMRHVAVDHVVNEMEKHLDAKIGKCKYCSCSFSTRHQLLRHLIASHNVLKTEPPASIGRRDASNHTKQGEKQKLE
jgi:hypothetical protein